MLQPDNNTLNRYFDFTTIYNVLNRNNDVFFLSSRLLSFQLHDFAISTFDILFQDSSFSSFRFLGLSSLFSGTFLAESIWFSSSLLIVLGFLRVQKRHHVLFLERSAPTFKFTFQVSSRILRTASYFQAPLLILLGSFKFTYCSWLPCCILRSTKFLRALLYI